jgi:hypothetical protein
MAMFKRGDRVCVITTGIDFLRAIEGSDGEIVSTDGTLHIVRINGAYPSARSFHGGYYVADGWALRDEDLALLDESTAAANSDSSETKRRFSVGDHVEIVGTTRESLFEVIEKEDDGTRVFGVVKFDEDGCPPDQESVLPDDRRFRNEHGDDGTWYINHGDLRHVVDTPSTADDSPHRYRKGDRVEIVGVPRTSIVESVDDHDSGVRLVGQVIARAAEYCDVLLDDERYRSDFDNQAWLVRVEDLRPEATPTAKPRRSSSRSKKATSDAQPLDPKRINVVQVDISKAIVGDDFPARPSQAFKDVMCELLIGEYERYGKSETDASS